MFNLLCACWTLKLSFSCPILIEQEWKWQYTRTAQTSLSCFSPWNKYRVWLISRVLWWSYIVIISMLWEISGPYCLPCMWPHGRAKVTQHPQVPRCRLGCVIKKATEPPNAGRESTVSYMLGKCFAPKADSNSWEREINCSKICNSNLPPVGDNPYIYPSDWMVFQVGSL